MWESFESSEFERKYRLL